MPWFQVDDQLPVHRKVLLAGNAAMGLWVRAGSWCQQNLTGGFVPSAIVKTLGTLSQAKALVAAGLWHPVKDGYTFHDWDEHQMSVEEILERRRKRAESGRKGGQASGQARAQAKAEASASLNANDLLKQKRTPVPAPVLSLVTSGGELTQVEDPEPPQFCPDHPGGTPDACIPCRDARRAHEAWERRAPQRKQREAARLQKIRESCRRCEGTSTYEDERGVHTCNHTQEAVNE